ncbi:MAG TPA: hypothetical protein VEK86_04515 [Gemmatimonadales bacterium]|nr:hypothetical protein [Gemmatimonadales bacterium]
MRGTKLGLLLFLAACDPGDVVLIRPDTGGPSARLVSIRALVDTPYSRVAESLGWSDGVPGAQVRLHRMEEPYDAVYWTAAVADTTGVATFADLLDGLYEVEVSRPLTAPEGALANDARVLAGGRRMYLPTPRVEGVTVAPDHRGSLVFSEVDLDDPSTFETGGRDYPGAKYFEVYNNSDTTIYLDGKYWGIGWHFNRDYPYWPCAQTSVIRNDPEGVWAEWILRFPGRGQDYPLQPGEAALVAKAAIDHRPVHAALPDLRGADFEWGGGNPDVPNLDDIGLRPMHPFWPGYGAPEFLSEPVDLTTLPRYVDPHSGSAWVRIPRASLLDTWVNTIDWTTFSYVATPACLEDMHRSFERLAGPASFWQIDLSQGLSHQRRVLTVLPDGRKILQDANTSMVDFVKAPRTPGWIP